jgi:polyisoprenoid-binding protein YceI
MKKHVILFGIAAVIFASCDRQRNGDTATVTDAQTLPDEKGQVLFVDTTGSMVAFTGWGVGKNHPGRFKFNSGSMTVKDGEITSGTFLIAINSMSMDQGGEMFNGKLRTHLLSKDFFEAEIYPEAKFEITKVEPYSPGGSDSSVVAGANKRISGNLTLKGITKNVTFPAKVDVSDDKVTAKADFEIDRTQWDMNYNADKESMKDKFISHDVNIRLDITGRR